MEKLRVTVLTGGTSAEREVCWMSGRKVMGALDPARYEAKCVDLAGVTGARAADLAQLLFAPVGEAAAAETTQHADGKPDVVFVALHGGAGENGTVQGMLELLGVPYTGSGVLASALAMNKIMAKKIFEREGIPTPKWAALRRSGKSDAKSMVKPIGLPCVVKPACEGSTIGVTVVRVQAELEPALELAFGYGPEAIVEQFVEGTEITGPVIGNDDARVLPLVEIVPRGGFYNYEAKYTPGATEEIVPARIPEATAAKARELTLRAHHALGCRGFSRVDMIAAPDEVYVLEVNTIPGLTETSLVPRAAEAAGMSFAQLVDRLIELALEGKGGGGAGRWS
jgi:D-alanine-D-alanine ligase